MVKIFVENLLRIMGRWLKLKRFALNRVMFNYFVVIIFINLKSVEFKWEALPRPQSIHQTAQLCQLHSEKEIGFVLTVEILIFLSGRNAIDAKLKPRNKMISSFLTITQHNLDFTQILFMKSQIMILTQFTQLNRKLRNIFAISPI